MEAAVDFGHRSFIFSCKYTTKGGRFLIVFDGSKRTGTGPLANNYADWIRELFVRLFLLLFGFLFESRKQGFGV